MRSGMSSSELVEDASGASFAYGVKCESSNPNARGGTGGYRPEIKWGRAHEGRG